MKRTVTLYNINWNRLAVYDVVALAIGGALWWFFGVEWWVAGPMAGTIAYGLTISDHAHWLTAYTIETDADKVPEGLKSQ
jgi:hypothetical protein